MKENNTFNAICKEHMEATEKVIKCVWLTLIVKQSKNQSPEKHQWKKGLRRGGDRIQI